MFLGVCFLLYYLKLSAGSGFYNTGMVYLQNVQLKQFENSGETAEFILVINNMFDILNSKKQFGENYKSPINVKNLEDLQG